jgi:hypothetical protein
MTVKYRKNSRLVCLFFLTLKKGNYRVEESGGKWSRGLRMMAKENFRA